jgi:hypothetical protein
MKKQEISISNTLVASKIANKIVVIRDVQVLLDRDIAEMYGVEIKALNQAVKRNPERFPDQFMFQLSSDEYRNVKKSLWSQLGMRTNSWTQLEDASCTLLKNKSPRRWKHSMI